VLDDPRAVCLGGEPVRIAGSTAGRVTTGGYGHRVERSIAFAYLPTASSEPGTAVEVDLFGDLIPGAVVSEPLYDPENARIRG
jgi:4-methylaminobutanoate oxidase (formaldehyde-forming)